MGIAELDDENGILWIRAIIICYGSASNQDICDTLAQEIQEMWNEPQATVRIKNNNYLVRFSITSFHKPQTTPEEVFSNTNPLYNYFRVEDVAPGNISFVDDLGSNTGYFLIQNLSNGSTTAAHEFGHTLGLPHPDDLDIRDAPAVGIMYPRGTLVQPQFQYYPEVAPGTNGGTLNPAYRKVLRSDIEDLKLHRLNFVEGKAIVGAFSSRFHPRYEQMA